jgi:molybdate transport system substrate-binding protein
VKSKSLKVLLALLCSLLLVAGCGKQEAKPLTIAAAASLEKIFTQRLIPLFNQRYPKIKIEGTYSGSGKLQLQIEQGLPAEIFVSASPKQMEALEKKGIVKKENVIDLLENKVVLIVPKVSTKKLGSFEELANCQQPALGEPKSVPAGQYAQEILLKLNLWEDVSKKASFGTGVTQVLHWVAEGSADAGIVYATDALTNKKVQVVAKAPQGTLTKPVIYCLGVLKTTDESKLFAEFLLSDEAQKIFEEYGFATIKR